MGVKQTTEANKNVKLRTRYYAESYQKTFEALLKVGEESKYKIVNNNQDFKEILMENKKFSVTVTMYQLQARETAMDFLVAYKGLFDIGFCTKEIIRLCDELSKQLSVKRV